MIGAILVLQRNMGVHWIDTTSSEFHGIAFTHTYDYGFYHGSMVFIEAMCSKTFLEQKQIIQV